MKMTRFSTALVWTASMTVFVLGKTVLADSPENDLFSGAKLVQTDFSEEVDTTEATTDADDMQLNEFCGAPATDASVWYEITMSEDSTLVVYVWESDYTAGVAVGTGTQSNLDIVTCGPGAVAFTAYAGETYYILAFDDQYDGGGNGGTLRISISATETPVLEVFTVNPVGTFTKSGGVTMTGTFACTGADYIAVDLSATQSVGRVSTVSGYGYFFDSYVGICNGETKNWSVDVVPYNGKFKGGKSLAVTYTYGCGLFDCFNGYVEQIVRVRGGPPKL